MTSTSKNYSPLEEDFFIKNLESTSRRKPRYRQTPSSDLPSLSHYDRENYNQEDYNADGYDAEDLHKIKYPDGEDLNEDNYVIKRSSGPLVMIFVIFIVIGIIVNLILLYNLDKFDRHGELISSDARNMAAINSVGLAILLAIIFGGLIFLMLKRGNNINMGVGFILLLLVAFVVIFLMGLLAGEYVNIGHLWAPIQVTPANLS